MGLFDKVFKKNDKESGQIDDKYKSDKIPQKRDYSSHIFISYSTRNYEIANAVCHYLEENGFKCWIAPRDISRGEIYVDQIFDAVMSAALIVLIGSYDSCKSKYVNNEIELAFNHDKFIVPFWIDDSLPKNEMEFYLKTIQLLQAYPRPEEHLDELLKVVKNIYDRNILNIDVAADDFNVFIAFSTRDKVTADAVCYFLESNDISCWIAPRDILPGEDFHKQIFNAVENSTIFLLLASENSYQSQFVERELISAFNSNKYIVSFKIDEQMPEGNYYDYLKNAYWLEGYPYPEDCFDVLVSDINKLLNSKDVPNTYYQIEKDMEFDLDDDSFGLKRPFDAYIGDEPYIFVSYAHKDSDIIFEEIKKFNDMGYPVWYDQGLTAGQEWDEEIEDALLDSSLLVVFITENSMASNNVVDEIKLALEEKIDIVPIYLENAELAKGLKLRLSQKHAIFKFRSDEEDYLENCFKAFDSAGIPQIGIKEVNKTEIVNSEDGIIPSNHPQPYVGDEPYLFASYSPMDEDMALHEIVSFQKMGYNVFYDDGDLLENAVDVIAERIMDSSLFVFFISNNAMNSMNIQQEVMFALIRKIKILPIYLEDFDEINSNSLLKLELSNIQGILKTELSEDEYIYKVTESFERYGLKSSLSSVEFNDNIFRAYNGDEPYIFAAYSHMDSGIVVPDLISFNDYGYNIWYDEGIAPGSEWDEEIAEAIINCSLFVVFISGNSMASSNVVDEIKLAIHEDIDIILIYLEDAELARGLKIRLINKQSILKYLMSHDEYIDGCVNSFKNYLE